MSNYLTNIKSKNIISFVLYLFVVIAMISCAQQERPRVTSKNELYLFLDTLEKRYETACTNFQIARWEMLMGRESYNLDSAQSELATIFLDTATQHIIEEWRARSNSLADKLLARRLELWHRAFIGGSINFDPEIVSLQNSIQQRFERYKFTLGGNKFYGSELINKLQREKKQNKRQVLWSTHSQIPDDIKRDFIRLIKLRNERAHLFGFPNYYSLILNIQSIDEGGLFKTLNSLEELTRNDFDKLVLTIKKKLRIKDFGPWDIEFVQKEVKVLPDKYFPADSIFHILHRFENRIGFHTDSLPINEAVINNTHSDNCICITIPNDIRILLSPQKGIYFYSIAFYQYGRALHAAHTTVDYPILKGYDRVAGTFNPSFEEGVALMHSEFVNDSLWLGAFTKAKEKEIHNYLSRRGSPALLRLRRTLKDFAVEYEIYKNPNENLDSLDYAMFTKYLSGTIKENGDYFFSFSSSYITSPCSFYKSILREMIAAQLNEALTSKFGYEKISNPKIAAWMIEYLYTPGETIEWWERLRNATGKLLEPGAYLRKLGIEQTTIITTN
ncbi:MAG: hypothetical protein QME52_04765 [Bacteroidota bacterium]|nr:hypothetical protein [Bacteroidota bacterium]